MGGMGYPFTHLVPHCPPLVGVVDAAVQSYDYAFTVGSLAGCDWVEPPVVQTPILPQTTTTAYDFMGGMSATGSPMSDGGGSQDTADDLITDDPTSFVPGLFSWTRKALTLSRLPERGHHG